MADVILGVDVGSRNVGLALIRRGKRMSILAGAVFPTPDGAVLDGELVHPEALERGLSAFLDSAPARAGAMAVCVNSPNIITRRLELPSIVEQETSAAVRMEILRQFPSVKDTHQIAQRIIRRDQAGAVKSTFAALCPTGLLRRYEELADLVGLPLRSADVRSNALAKALENYWNIDFDANNRDMKTAKRVGVLLDIGWQSSCVTIVEGGDPMLSRTIAIGADAFDGAVKDASGQNDEEVERARLSGAFDGDLFKNIDTAATVEYCFGDLKDQLEATVGRYLSEREGGRPEFLTLTGDGAAIPGLGERLAKVLSAVGEQNEGNDGGIRFFSLDAPKAWPKSESALAESGEWKIMLAAVGAASGRPVSAKKGARASSAGYFDINFINNGAADIASRVAMTRIAATLAALGVVALLGGCLAYAFAARGQADADAAEAASVLIEQNAESSQLERDIASAEERLSDLAVVINAMDNASAKVSEALDVVTSELPEGVFITGLSAPNEREITLSGKSRDFAGAPGFAGRLRGAEAFDGVLVDSVVADEGAAGEGQSYSFTMTLTVKN